MLNHLNITPTLKSVEKLFFTKPVPSPKKDGTPALDYVFLKGRDYVTLIEKLSLEHRKPNKHLKMNSYEVSAIRHIDIYLFSW